MISTLMSGYFGSSLASFGQSTVSAACSPVVMRMVPAGLSAKFAQGVELGLDLLEPRPDGPQQALARLGRRDAAGGARQQPEAEPRLQVRGWCG